MVDVDARDGDVAEHARLGVLLEVRLGLVGAVTDVARRGARRGRREDEEDEQPQHGVTARVDHVLIVGAR